MSKQDETEQKIDDLERKVNYLLAILMEKKHKEEKVVHYHIKHLEIQSAQFERLDYHLESISIEQLSGKLNIGNNFSTDKKTDSIPPTNNKKQPVKKTETKKPHNKTNNTRPLSNDSHRSKESDRLKVTKQKRGFSVALQQKEGKNK